MSALVRSGRIELWLETRLPDYNARLEILQDQAKDLPTAIKKVNLEKLAKETEDLTGADLRRLIEDGKILVAYDKSKKKKLKDANDYFQQAMETIRTNKEKYQEAERRAFEKAAAAPSRAPYFGRYYPGNGDDEDN